jgi:signal transduction histidine kinase
MSDRIQPVAVRDAVAAVIRTMQPRLIDKRLDDVVDIPPDVAFLADPEKVRAILLTLLSNAIDYNEPGGYVMVDLGYPVDGVAEDVVMLRVGDSGVGIPLEEQQQIFDASTIVHHRDPLEHGPGLARAREWARDMGGDLRVRSDDGGSVFTLKLPRAG